MKPRSVSQSVSLSVIQQLGTCFDSRTSNVYRLPDSFFHEAPMYESKGPLSIVSLTFAQATASFDI